MTDIWSAAYRGSRLAAVSGLLAVPTEGRIHVWDPYESRQCPSLGGPVASVLPQSVCWEDRNLLLTGSEADGVVALWDLHRPVARGPGHEATVVAFDVVEAVRAVVSADAAGTIVTRDSDDGRLRYPPLSGDVQPTRVLAAWADGERLRAATGVGTTVVADGTVRRWDLTAGTSGGEPVAAHRWWVDAISRVDPLGTGILVTFGPRRMLKLWRMGDGVSLAEIRTELRARPTGFAVGAVDEGVVVVISTDRHPLTVYRLDHPSTPPRILPEAGNDVVLDLSGSRLVTAGFSGDTAVPTTVRAWDLAGTRVGRDLPGNAEVVAAAVRRWPVIYVGRADGTVAVVDIVEGREICRPVSLPRPPRKFRVSADGDLFVLFGNDLTRLAPPVS